MQATEVVKLLTGVGETLEGRLLAYDAADLSFDEVTVRPNPSCPVCGEDPAVTSVRDVEYGARCAVGD
jgi:adenylyltransferase/sulfurtransferase